MGEGRIFRARILEVQGSETGEWGFMRTLDLGIWERCIYMGKVGT